MIKKTVQYLKEKRLKYKKQRKFIRRIALFLFLIWYMNSLPDRLFNDSTSTVLLDRNGDLLGAKIADDGQWRFPASEHVPHKVAVCIVEFEDRNFYTHIGISAKGIGRALVQNFKNKRVVSGGSTITMQLVRLMHKNPPRTYTEKIYEMILATRLELRYSKTEILALYASNAPFGNNVVGLDAAAWRYFGRSADKLSWAESATLAVLPNAPGLIYPGKNQKSLLEKRNRLLKHLYDANIIDQTSFALSLDEPLPQKPFPLPQLAPHLLSQFIKEGHKGERISSTIDPSLQEKVLQQLSAHSNILQENGIYNGAVLITSVKTGEVLAYVGNTTSIDAEQCSDVNCITAPRSTGSILKPLLYAKALEDGIITPGMLLSDIPSQFGSFSPKNFTGQFHGALPANSVLSHSLNIPMVHLLNNYGVTKFHAELKDYGLTTLTRPAKHYGLSLILGGAEAKLFDLSRVYTQMAQELKYGASKELKLLRREELETPQNETQKGHTQTDRACIYSTFQAMIEVNRPDEENQWKSFSSSQKIAWKTGTSFGFRDAWAIGITPDYVVSVWIGNADGEGRPGLTGVNAAAPLLFDLFRFLPASKSWFKEPVQKMITVKICKESGHRASDLCTDPVTSRIPASCAESRICPYHQLIHLDLSGTQRVDSDCESVYNMKHQTWFVLPAIVERYYKFSHPNYKVLPEYKPECLAKISDKSIVLLYPRPNTKIYIPIELDGSVGETVFEANHRNSNTKIYWHLDENYIGETKEIHHLSLRPAIGKHKLTLVDENGISLTLKFEVVGKTKNR